MSQTVPIQLTPIPVPVDIKATDINGLLQIIAQFMGASINQDVSFFLEVSSDPTQYSGDIIYNTSDRLFKGWDTGSGKYLPITPFNEGDVKQSFLAGDEVSAGWVVLDGRLISSIQGISQEQQAVLYQLFGLGSNLPTVKPLQSLVNLPASGSFAQAVPAAVAPPVGQIGALTFSTDYNPVEEQALATNTETLLGSVVGVNTSITTMATLLEAMLTSLNGSGSGPLLYAKVYIGSL